MTRAVLCLLALVTFVACNEPSFSDVKPIEFTSESISAGPYMKTLGFTWALNLFTGIDDYRLVVVDHFALYQNLDGVSGSLWMDINGDGLLNALDQIALTEDNTETFASLFLVDFDRGSYQVVAREADKTEVTFSADLSLSQIAVETLIGYFKASNSGAGDLFGRVSLSGDGNTLAIGAPGERSNATGIDGDQNDNSLADAGAVYVFSRDIAGLWSQEAYIKASNTDALDSFGGAVSLSNDGSRLAVGAVGEASNAEGPTGPAIRQDDNSLPDAGAVYVFTRNNQGNWSQTAYIKASNTDAGDRFGHSVNISPSGTKLAIGAPGERSNATGIDGDQNDNSLPNAGAVYVFRRAGTTNWAQEVYIKASNTDAGDEFGGAVSLSSNGSALVVGARFEDSNATGVRDDVDDPDQDDNSLPDSGAAYVFGYRRPGPPPTPFEWTQDAYVKASNSGAGDEFGGDVSLGSGGGKLAVGAEFEDSSATGIDGDQSNDDSADSGAVYVFAFDSGESPPWVQEVYIKASNTGVDDAFGAAVDLMTNVNPTLEQADVLVVGAPGEDSNATGLGGDQSDDSLSESGAAYSFWLPDQGVWTQLNYIKATNTDAGDEFGGAVSLTAAANTLVVGAEFEASDATGIGGDQSDDSAADAGAAYLY